MQVEELLKSKDIRYEPRGKDLLVRCLNPEHEDRHPSMRIDRIQGIFNCLSCGFHGNIFSFYDEKPNWLQIRREKLKTKISDKLQTSVGLNIPDNAVSFENNWRNISKETFKKFEAFQHNQPEFLARVVFPIRTISGKITAFCGRHTGDGVPKYLIYPHGVSLPLFPTVKPIKDSIILVEGIFDMLNLHDKGLNNAVCAFGVNQLNKDKINILKIQGIQNVDIFYDNDEAGNKGAEEAKKLLENSDITTRHISFKDVKDPGELTALQVLKLKETLYDK